MSEPDQIHATSNVTSANSDNSVARARLLLVDDDRTNLLVMQELLEDEYECLSVNCGELCLEKLPAFKPDVVLLDIMMPGMNGYEACKKLKAMDQSEQVNVILISAKAALNERLAGYAAGADDYIVKPFDHHEFLAKVGIQVRLRRALVSLAEANRMIKESNDLLENKVKARTEEVVATRNLTVFALAKLADSRDQETGQHLERMREYSQLLAIQLSKTELYRAEITPRFLECLYLSSPLHDIGKVGIPDAILKKPGPLTKAEFDIMKQHAIIGAQALQETINQTEHGCFLLMAVQIARHHHERYDGRGYPDGLKGVETPLPARIVAVADSFDAMTSRRVYKEAWDPEVARDIILGEKFRQFDPTVVDAFKACYPEFLAVHASSQEQEKATVQA